MTNCEFQTQQNYTGSSFIYTLLPSSLLRCMLILLLVISAKSMLAQTDNLEFTVDKTSRTVTMVADENLAQQEINEKTVSKTYKKMRKSLPKQYSKYKLTIMLNGLPLEEYIPRKTKDYAIGGLWEDIDYNGKPWTWNISRPNRITHGLANRHLSLWASHGRYYDQKKGFWKWQRPNLFGTTEDLFTQTIVVPFLIPMLENAGANVFTPRERDWQSEEIIVDNDGCLPNGKSFYSEHSDGKPWTTTGKRGFGWQGGVMRNGENAFAMGSARTIAATRKADKAAAIWQPFFKEEGRYAVYVSYQTMDNSIDDAQYTVHHKGQQTVFTVNQKMGGGTWVYLGTFEFDKGSSIYNCVTLSNQSRKRGVVTADAVRFGGGMGNIERGGTISGYPRALEGARYYAQWAGAPTSVYNGKNGTDDYTDDINARSKMSNWIAGGSPYVPALDGLKVPIEMSLAIHSDAGFERDGKGLVGSLAICTTDFNDGRLNSGISRLSSKDFAEELLSGLMRDISFKYGKWNRRYLWDRNYSETRLPEVPSAIIETLSHQSFPDMKLGCDPNFQFTMARSLYKTILRFVNNMHGTPYIVQPLKPHSFSVRIEDGSKARLTWVPENDPLEPTAVPTSYNIYVSAGTGGFDNGTNVKGTSYTLELEPGVTYNFRVTAVNRGGESFPSETLSARVEPGADKTVLIVNGFTRLSTPAVIDNASAQGFDIDADPGVSYGLTAGWNGRQLCFNKSRMGVTGPGGLGFCGDEMAGKFVAGNTFNYVTTHAEAIAAARRYNIASSSVEAVQTGRVDMRNYDCVDIIMGLQKYDVYNPTFYKTFPSTLRNAISSYLQHNGRLFVSGAYCGSDMTAEDERLWMGKTFKANMQGALRTDSLAGVNGMGLSFDFFRTLNASHYASTRCDVLAPMDGAICPAQYSDGSSAGVAFKGDGQATFLLGFPFECITEPDKRATIMTAILSYLM